MKYWIHLPKDLVGHWHHQPGVGLGLLVWHWGEQHPINLKYSGSGSKRKSPVTYSWYTSTSLAIICIWNPPLTSVLLIFLAFSAVSSPLGIFSSLSKSDDSELAKTFLLLLPSINGIGSNKADLEKKSYTIKEIRTSHKVYIASLCIKLFSKTLNQVVSQHVQNSIQSYLRFSYLEKILEYSTDRCWSSTCVEPPYASITALTLLKWLKYDNTQTLRCSKTKGIKFKSIHLIKKFISEKYIIKKIWWYIKYFNGIQSSLL